MRKPIMGPSPYSVRRFAAVTTFAHPLGKYQLIWRRKYLTISFLKIPKERKALLCKIKLRRMGVTREQMTCSGQTDCAQKKKRSNVFVVSITPPSLCMGRISKVGQQIHIFSLSFLLNFRLSEIFHRF